MKVKYVIDEDFVNYKLPSMFIGCHSCTFKCDKECRKQVCQNGALANSPDIEIPIRNIINRYLNNDISKSVIFGGLEPFDDIDNVLLFIIQLRNINNIKDDIVIYTGYTEEEVNQKYKDYLEQFKKLSNIIIKFGRFIPDQQSHYDYVLGVNLASDNQYAKKIS